MSMRMRGRRAPLAVAIGLLVGMMWARNLQQAWVNLRPGGVPREVVGEALAGEECDIEETAKRYGSQAKSVSFNGCMLAELSQRLALDRALEKMLRVEQLELNGCNLIDLPKIPPTVRVLLLGGNDLRHLNPQKLPRSLEYLGVRGNNLESVDCQGFPQTLRALVLTDNKIRTLRNLADSLPRLEKLLLSHNQLTSLPTLPSSLLMLRLSNNPALELSGAKKWFREAFNLSWVAVSETRVAAPSALHRSNVLFPSESDFDADSIPVDGTGMEQLGQGASGSVFKGSLITSPDGESAEPVAIKYFKSAGSDGQAAAEIDILRRVIHPDIVHARGFVKSKQGAEAAVLVKFLPGAQKLGEMPTFESCVRDSRPKFMSAELAMTAAAAVARAMLYLHSHGIAHGDLYGHNILWRKSDSGSFRVYLSDFGASWLVPDQLEFVVRAAEVRSYGVLLLDLLQWLGSNNNPVVKQRLGYLAEQCLDIDPRNRPDFVTIAAYFKSD